MMTRTFLLAAACNLALGSAAFAQTAGSEVQRDINQQQRIEQGLKSGALTTGEAGRLERGETRIEKMESNALKDGQLSPAEKARIGRAQNAESGAISRLKNNGVTGDPNSASSKRMQVDVQRNVNQQSRIEQGVQNGSLGNRELGQLEKGQSRVTRREAKAAANGHVGAGEQKRIQQAENRQSRQIHREKTD